MNTGDFSYGRPSGDNDFYFKDFEFEISSAAFLSEYGSKSIFTATPKR
jgi:hypothetical protein